MNTTDYIIAFSGTVAIVCYIFYCWQNSIKGIISRLPPMHPNGNWYVDIFGPGRVKIFTGRYRRYEDALLVSRVWIKYHTRKKLKHYLLIRKVGTYESEIRRRGKTTEVQNNSLLKGILS
jgi:hypothetical protein